MIEARRKPGRPPGRWPRGSPQYIERERKRQREVYRRAHGIPLDAPITTGAGRWKEPSWQCARCREPHAPGSDLCHDHLQAMEELARERRRNGEP